MHIDNLSIDTVYSIEMGDSESNTSTTATFLIEVSYHIIILCLTCTSV